MIEMCKNCGSYLHRCTCDICRGCHKNINECTCKKDTTHKVKTSTIGHDAILRLGCLKAAIDRLQQGESHYTLEEITDYIYNYVKTGKWK